MRTCSTAPGYLSLYHPSASARRTSSTCVIHLSKVRIVTPGAWASTIRRVIPLEEPLLGSDVRTAQIRLVAVWVLCTNSLVPLSV